ncbi:MAG TPA: glycosyltransferase family 4 protein [Paracoccaceae bacterium]|nr:glycosyltransferase family 4 protein [Paracoccaceae bacterium]HMO70073.1 glycosyltransferase family 4 protein [Paracoccaceae bacterium]
MAQTGRHPAPAARHLALLNYSGDYREAYLRLSAGGPETYFAQRYSVEAVARQLQAFETVASIICRSHDIHDETLPNGVRSIGLGLSEPMRSRDIIRAIRKVRPTHLVLGHLKPALLLWAVWYGVPVCVISPTSIARGTGLKARLRAGLTALLLNSGRVRWVAAYGRAAARSFQEIGVDPAKIVPWDFLIRTGAPDHPPLRLRQGKPWRLVYVGQMIASKGIPDAIRAIRLLREQGHDSDLTLVGLDAEGAMARVVAAEGMAGHVHFAGAVGNADLEPFIRRFDAIIVPSRPDYPEGFPLVLAHAMRARLPIVASDHPMFTETLRNGENAMIFPAGDHGALAGAVRRLLEDDALYAHLSDGSLEVLDGLRLPVRYDDVLRNAFEEAGPGRDFMSAQSLAATRRPAS